MKLSKFLRDYKLTITLNSGEVLEIKPEIRVQFDITKGIKGGLNTCNIAIYNLSKDKRAKLIKDKEDTDTFMPFILEAGYNKIGTIFIGQVTEAYSVKRGADFITFVNSVDGYYDFINSFTAKTIKGNYLEHILADMQNTQKGKITKEINIFRPRVLVGNSFKLIEDTLEDGEICFIDNGALHIVKEGEAVDGYIPLISAETGLLETPVKKSGEINFRTLLNPEIKLGSFVEVESVYAPHTNGTYYITNIRIKGDNYGTEWVMEVTGKDPNALRSFYAAK